jgi:dTDP-4-dehydrorhamnose reductase
MTRVLVLGATGMLGHKLCQELSAAGMEVAATVRAAEPGPLRELPFFRQCSLVGGVDALREGTIELALESTRPDWVVNCIGIVKQRPEAHDRYRSVGINAWLPHRLAALAAGRGARLIHFSTDCVFSGSKGAYTEDDPSDAHDLYGRSKYLGETDSAETAALTLRSSIIGHEIAAPHTGLLEWFLRQPAEAVDGFVNAIYSGLTTLEMAGLVARLVAGNCQLAGTWHVASEPISKFDLLGLVKEAYGLRTTIRRNESFACDRSLCGNRFAAATGYRAPPWPALIEAMAEEASSYTAMQAANPCNITRIAS